MTTLTLDINNPKEHCNLACQFCYSSGLTGILTLQDITRILSGHGSVRNLEIGGGEPLLHPEIAEILSYLLTTNFRLFISTNGTAISKALLNLPIEQRRRLNFQLSIHASTERLYGQITGHPELYQPTIDNLPVFRDNFPTQINSAVYKINFEDIPNLVELIHSYRPLSHRINLVMPVGKGANVELLSQEELSDLTSYLLSKRSEGYNLESPLLHPISCPVLEKAYHLQKSRPCPIEKCAKLYINPEGVYACEFKPIPKK